MTVQEAFERIEDLKPLVGLAYEDGSGDTLTHRAINDPAAMEELQCLRSGTVKNGRSTLTCVSF